MVPSLGRASACEQPCSSPTTCPLMAAPAILQERHASKKKKKREIPLIEAGSIRRAHELVIVGGFLLQSTRLRRAGAAHL